MEQFTVDLLMRFDFPEETTLTHQTRIEEDAGVIGVSLHHTFVIPSRSSVSDEVSELQFVGGISLGAARCGVEGKAQGILEESMGDLRSGLHVFFEAREEVDFTQALDRLEIAVRAISALTDIPTRLGIRIL
ncbi:hypothetical protein [Jidongwangia harbinensis]|uniref:hypothetical protein n=1 Tax=Jidongwangia harbinensis TaxID=2878561 RepID=UPI001CD9321C|nr:hypothetical protein [Jidongwangia harbinensis]MCA2214143.1 hypothetical protein [Jidongwangia harbinensis]